MDLSGVLRKGIQITKEPAGQYLAGSFVSDLSGEGEFHGDAEVGGNCGVGRSGDERDVLLPVEEGTHGEETGEGVVGSSLDGVGGGAVGGCGNHRLDVAVKGILHTIGEVEAEVQVVADSAASGG